MEWEIKSNRLTKSYVLHSFDEIILKLMLVAKTADDMNHHPDFAVENYNHITFYLWTHSANSISEKDYDLALELDKIFEE